MAPQEEVSKPKQTLTHLITVSPQRSLRASGMPLSAWVCKVHSTSTRCGEEPDSGEDLEIQYIDTKVIGKHLEDG